jgi:hypothetical protein
MKSTANFQALALTTSLLFALTACAPAPSGGGGGGGAASAPGAPAAGGASAGVISPDDKPLDVMTKAMRSQLDARSFRARMEQSAANGMTNTMLVEYVSPDRYHVVREAKAGAKDPRLEYVIVGKETYAKTGDGPWTKFPVDMGGMISSFKDPKIIEELRKGGEVKFVGPDTLDGKPMLVYQYTMDKVGAVAIKSVTKTWVSVADGMPRKSESDAEYQGTKLKTVYTVSDYNTDIKIDLPAR